MNKFLNTFHLYSIKEEAHRQVRQKILDICKTGEFLSLDQNFLMNQKIEFHSSLHLITLLLEDVKSSLI